LSSSNLLPVSNDPKRRFSLFFGLFVDFWLFVAEFLSIFVKIANFFFIFCGNLLYLFADTVNFI
jgi:hypothetical protein